MNKIYIGIEDDLFEGSKDCCKDSSQLLFYLFGYLRHYTLRVEEFENIYKYLVNRLGF